MKKEIRDDKDSKYTRIVMHKLLNDKFIMVGKGNICRAIETKSKDIKRICKKYGLKSSSCRKMKRRVC